MKKEDAKYCVKSHGNRQIWHRNSISDEDIPEVTKTKYYKTLKGARNGFEQLALNLAGYFEEDYDKLLENGDTDETLGGVCYVATELYDESGEVELFEIKD